MIRFYWYLKPDYFKSLWFCQHFKIKICNCKSHTLFLWHSKTLQSENLILVIIIEIHFLKFSKYIKLRKYLQSAVKHSIYVNYSTKSLVSLINKYLCYNRKITQVERLFYSSAVLFCGFLVVSFKLLDLFTKTKGQNKCSLYFIWGCKHRTAISITQKIN